MSRDVNHHAVKLNRKNETTYVVRGDGAGRVARDKLDLGGHGPVDELLLCPEHAACKSHAKVTYIYVRTCTSRISMDLTIDLRVETQRGQEPDRPE
jgi:hypothetical protein